MVCWGVRVGQAVDLSVPTKGVKRTIFNMNMETDATLTKKWNISVGEFIPQSTPLPTNIVPQPTSKRMCVLKCLDYHSLHRCPQDDACFRVSLLIIFSLGRRYRIVNKS